MEMKERCTPTSLTGIIYQNDFLEQGAWRAIDHTPNGTQERRPGFIMENYHNWGGGQLSGIVFVATTGKIGKAALVTEVALIKLTTPHSLLVPHIC